MTIKQQGGIFGRNPTFNDVDVEGTLNVDGTLTTDAITTSGNVDVQSGFLQVSADPTPVIRLSGDGNNSAGTTFGELQFFNNDTSGVGPNIAAFIKAKSFSSSGGGGELFFGTIGSAGSEGQEATEQVEIDLSGNVRLIGGGNVVVNSGQGILCGVTSTDRNAVVRADLPQGVVGSAVYISRSGGSTAKSQIEFANSNGVVGSITTSGSATAYNTSSDYRLKTDVQPMTGASDRVKSLSPVNFEWISDGTRVDGFLAHEVQEIVPEAVHGAKDAMREEEYEVTAAVLDEEGNIVTEAVIGTRQVPDYQAIDQSKLVPLLTAALQEALAKIEQLEGRVASLEV